MGFFRNKTKYIGDSRRFNFRFDLYVYGKHFDFVCVYFQGFFIIHISILYYSRGLIDGLSWLYNKKVANVIFTLLLYPACSRVNRQDLVLRYSFLFTYYAKWRSGGTQHRTLSDTTVKFQLNAVAVGRDTFYSLNIFLILIISFCITYTYIFCI